MTACFDTTGSALLRAGVTLRRHDDGEDAGWHLTLPVESGSATEVHLPLGDASEPPAELAALVRGWTRGDALVEVEPASPPPPGRVGEPDLTGAASVLVHQRLLDLVGGLAAADPLARQGDPVGVHHARRAARRLRALLATYGPLLERERTDPVREELRWLARALGAARDQEVVHAQLEERVGELPLELVRGPVLARIRRHHDQRERVELDEVLVVLDSERYLALRSALDDLAAAPPWSATAHKKARKVLPRLVAREWKRLRHRRRDAEDPHEVRKAAKRMRYAYEVLQPAWGADASRPRKAAKSLTEVLGARQDGVVARAVLLELADEAAAAHEETFTYGLLHAELLAREPAQLAAAERSWIELAKLSW